MLCNLPLKSYFHGGSLDLFSESVPQANTSIIGTLHDLSGHLMDIFMDILLQAMVDLVRISNKHIA